MNIAAIGRFASVASVISGNEQAQDFFDKYGLPEDAEISFDETTKIITIVWRGKKNMDLFRKKFPDQFHRDNWLYCPVEKAKLEILPDRTIVLETVFFGRLGWGKEYKDPRFLVQKGIVACERDRLAIQITEVLEEYDLPENHERYDW